MRLLNDDTDTALARLTLLLTREEASELRDTLEAILADDSRHEHVPSGDYAKEITVAVYDTANVERFNARCQRLIREDT